MTIKRLVCRSMAGLAAIILVLAALVVPSVGTEGPYRAGLIIVHGDGRVITRCLTFPETTITGLELLQRSGLDLNLDLSSAMGAAVCRIDNEGCTFPSQSCFCRCQGMTCVYWSYWHLTPDGTWQYSNLGAGGWLLHDGDVDAWVWGAVTNTTINQLPTVRFSDICTPPTPTESPTVTAAALPPTATPASPTGTPTPVPATDTQLPPTVTAAPPADVPFTPTPVIGGAAATATPTAADIPGRPSPLPESAVQSPTVALPTATWQPVTPVVATPTAPSAASPLPVPPTVTPTRPVRADVPDGLSGVTAGEASPTAVAAPVVAVQRANPTTVSPVPMAPLPTPLSGGNRHLRPTPLASPTASAVSSEMRQALVFILVGVGLLGVVLARARRRRAP
jgi:hypothetical protein